MNVNDLLYSIVTKMESCGWSPLVTVATQHGKTLCFHIFAAELHEDKSQDRYAYFRRSEDTSVLKNENTFFKDSEECQQGYEGLKLLISKIPHVTVDMEKFMESMKGVA